MGTFVPLESKGGVVSTLERVEVRTAGDFGDFMRRARLDQNLTQAELAAEVGKTRKWVSQVELGQTMPTLPAVILVARVLGFSLALDRVDPAGEGLLTQVLGEL